MGDRPKPSLGAVERNGAESDTGDIKTLSGIKTRARRRAVDVSTRLAKSPSSCREGVEVKGSYVAHIGPVAPQRDSEPL